MPFSFLLDLSVELVSKIVLALFVERPRGVRSNKRMKTIIELYKDALSVQDACNLSGVVNGFSRALNDLREHVSGTDALRNHPVAILWADKVAHLTGTQSFGSDVVSHAYQAAYSAIEDGIL